MTWNQERCGHALNLFYRTGNPDYVRPPLISTDKEEVHFFPTRIASHKRSMFLPKVNVLKANTSKFDMNRFKKLFKNG
jgi:hypothetical protein